MLLVYRYDGVEVNEFDRWVQHNFKIRFKQQSICRNQATINAMFIVIVFGA